MSLARIHKGDQVVVLSGKDKGKKGKVLETFPEFDRVLVEGVNVQKRHTKPTMRNREGGIFEREHPIHASKVMPIDPETGKGTRVKTRVEADGSLRLGLCLVQGLPKAQAASLLAERARRPFASLDDLKARTTLGAEALRALASIGALNAWSTDRRSALWHAERPLRRGELPGQEGGAGTAGEPRDPVSPLARMSPDERLAADYATLRLTTGPHPMALRREGLRETVWRSDQLREAADGTVVRAAGQVICRQRPGTAKGVCFVSLEDEAGITNVIVSPELFEAERLKISTEPFLVVEGVVEVGCSSG